MSVKGRAKLEFSDLVHLRIFRRDLESGTNLLAKRGEVRRICLPSRGRSPRDGRQILLTSPSFARRLIRLLGWRSGISKTTDRISTL